MHERPARAGAHLALVEGEHHEPLDRLVEEVVIRVHHVGHEDVRALAAELEGDGDDVLRGVLHDQAPGGGLAGEGDLGHPVRRRQRLAGLDAEPVHDVEHTGGQQVLDQLGDDQDRHRGLLGRLEHDAVARGEGRRDLPGGHQDREVPRDDLGDHAERLVVVVGDRVVVDGGDAALLCPEHAGEVPEVVDGEG